MNTYEITREELAGMEVLAEGYKAIKWDSSCMQGSFRYGETDASLVGKIFKVDGCVAECKWGLHFSKDPAYVFNFYEPLGYNRYFKVRAYGVCADAKDGYKSVASIVEFVEEYDLMQFIEIIKRFNRSAVSGSSAVGGSSAVSDSSAVSYSYGLRECEAASRCLFCHRKEGAKWYLFNKKITYARFEEVFKKIKSFNWWPKFDNWYDIKGDKEWWAFCFPQLAIVDNDIAWSKMPTEMVEYIKSLPEFDQKVWDKITGK